MPLYMECRHIKASGAKCESPALTGGEFCYYHSKLKRTARQQPARQGELQYQSPDQPLDLPPLEDNCSIQLALSKVICAIASGNLDPKRAGMLLYGLQIASQNARHASPFALEPVEEVILTSDGDELGPLQTRCDDEIGCEACDSKEECDEIEKATWEAEIEQFKEHYGEAGEEPNPEEQNSERRIPEERIRETRVQAALPAPSHPVQPNRAPNHGECSRNCHSTSGSSCSAANFVPPALMPSALVSNISMALTQSLGIDPQSKFP